jgi:glyoxylase-like metal-dependent hydrolase (beta-lactamase superfamily II)/ferredoxin
VANPAKRLPDNVSGDFFVDATCIDCDTCRWMAPRTFRAHGDHSVVHTQPTNADDVRDALRALVACPTASIGVSEKHDVAAAAAEFPIEIAPGVFHCGYHSEKSFGAASYFVVRPAGNVLVDSPRFAAPLVKRIAELGGVSLMFLTHRDDVADHAKFRERFGCERVIHADDADAADVERTFAGTDAVALADDLVAIPVPGHTAGSACLLWKNEVLFTGDHLAWSGRRQELYAFRDACWFDWRAQTESMKRLAAFDFAWVLPGHGRRAHFGKDEMRRRMANCVAWMEAHPEAVAW